MHYLFVNRHYGGEQVPTGRMLNDLVSSLLSKGHKVTILTTKTSYKGTSGSEMLGNKEAKVIYLPTLGDWSRLVIWGLFWLQSNLIVPFLKWDRCIVLTDPPFLTTVALFSNLFSKRKVFWWTMDLYPEALVADGMFSEKGKINNFLRALNDISIKKLSGVIALGECQKKRLESYKNWISDDSFSMIQPPWDKRPIPKVDPSTNRFIPKLELKEDEKIVLYAGNLGRAHSFMPLVEAAKYSQSMNKKLVFIFVCQGNSKAALEAETKGMENVKIMEYQPVELTGDLLWSADLHVITLKEGWEGICVPSKLYGVLQTDSPVLFIGNKNAGTANEIRKSNAGITVDENISGKDLAEMIENTVLNPPARKKQEDSLEKFCEFISA